MKRRTIVRRTLTQPESADQIDYFASLQHIHPVLQRIFITRGIKQASELDYSLKHLLPYDSLTGIATAVELLYQALQQQQKILVIGDFDADGATSTALSVRVLKAFGAQHVDYLVPNRFEFGYGLSPEIVDVAIGKQPDLIMTVDNGIMNHAGVERAKAAGISVLITDHHLAGDTLPAADAIVNPNQPGDQFASKNLAGVGVAFYVLIALRAKLITERWFVQQKLPVPTMSDYLDIVALGTVADVVPLDHNNRILVYQGLRRIRAGRTVAGIKALLSVAKRSLTNINAQDLGFAIGPRLNAAGRMDDMSHGIACLLADDDAKAWHYATELDNFNQERKSVEQTMQQQALEALKTLHAKVAQYRELPLGICLYNPDWHQGVIGILASRIKDKTHRPVIIFAQDQADTIKGSARSIKGIHVRDILAEIDARHPGLLIKYGGHAMAAGLSIAQKNLANFTASFNQLLAHKIDKSVFAAQLVTDGALSADNFTLRFAELLDEYGPWGQNFPLPSFDGRFTIVEQRILAGKHLKLVVCPEKSDLYLDAIAFNINVDDWPGDRCRKVALVYQMHINEYQERRKLQLMIEQIEPIQLMELA